MVRAMAGYGVPAADIARVAAKGVSESDFSSAFADELEEGQIQAAAKLQEQLYTQAVNGNTAALLHLSRQQLGQAMSSIATTADMCSILGCSKVSLHDMRKRGVVEEVAARLKAAGATHVGTHGIRHRSATDIANSGIPVKVGMALTAHFHDTRGLAGANVFAALQTGVTRFDASLGGIGGRYFTPIINAPEVSILGVCKSSTEPRWDGKAFQPRLILPLSLSWDHRVIDGAAAARFNAYFAAILADFRRVLL